MYVQAHNACDSTHQAAIMSIGRTDLNLLKVFEAVYEERNLILAGKRLHLTQSAVSHALRRLRELVGDELFIRTGKGMEPTGRAMAMAPSLLDSLRRIQDAFGMAPFAPEQSQRRFVVAANDLVTEVIIAPLSRELLTVAPAVDLVIRPSTRLDLAEQIDLGRIDLAIGIFSQVPSRFSSRELMSQGESILMRRGHPASRRKLKVADLGKYPLVTLSVGGHEEGAVGGFIVERGLARQSEMFDRRALEHAFNEAQAIPRVRVTVPHSLAIPALLRDTDMLAVVPSLLAKALASNSDLICRASPYAGGHETMCAVWHGRDDYDVGHTWLRELVARVARTAEQALQ